MMRRPSLNFTFRLVWSKRLGTYVPVPEVARSCGRGRAAAAMMTALLAGAAHGGAALANDLPTGGTVVAGSSTIAQSGTTMTITQSTQHTAINWDGFSIGQGHTVTFVQPSSSAVALNRVLGSDVSLIQGALNANGQVFLVNPNGVLFSPTAQVNVGGLVASTLNIATDDFMAGNYAFEGASANAVVNQGNITAQPGGAVALIAARIVNDGSITADGGAVLMGAGSRVVLDLGGPVKIEVETAAIDALVEQGGAVRADGGLVYLTAKAVGGLTSTVINHTGITQARTLTEGGGGEIYLMGDMVDDRIVVGGTLDASAPNGGNGGFIETSAATVTIAEDFAVTTRAADGQTGRWLVDPNDYTVAASGGDMTGAQLTAALALTDVELESVQGDTAGNGDIFINDTVSWGANTLTLTAERDININAVMTATDNAKLVMTTGAAGDVKVGFRPGEAQGFAGRVDMEGTTELTINGDPYIIITELGAQLSATGTDLQGMNAAPWEYYALGANIDASATATWGGGAGFTPIAEHHEFTGTFNGLGHVIEGLWIDRPGQLKVGLFKDASASAISNVGLVDVTVRGGQYVGALVGYATLTSVANSYASGIVHSYGGYGGGLVGAAFSSDISDSYAAVEVTGGQAGGLVGLLNGTRLEGGAYVSSAISNSYATGDVRGADRLGGLVGAAIGGNVLVTNSYATGAVGSFSSVFNGGLIGFVYSYIGGAANQEVVITNSYASGPTTGSQDVGGLVGRITGDGPVKITNTYASGASTGGGLIGSSSYNAVVTASFWDSSLNATSDGGTGFTTADMKSLATYAGWDIDSTSGTGAVWRIYDGHTTPLLRSFLTPLAITATADDKVYDGTTTLTGGAIVASPADYDASLVLGAPNHAIASSDVGTHAISLGLYSSHAGYDIAVSGTVDITPRPVTVTADVSAVYGDAVPDLTAAITSGSLVNGDTATGALTRATGTDAGVYAITQGTWDLGSNYAVTFVDGALTITPRAITVTADDQSKVYGNADPTLTWAVTGGSLVGADSLSGSLARDAGENVGAYAITGGTLANANYTISVVDGELTVTPRAITVTADDQSKVYGDTDPTLTWAVTDGSLVGADSLSGSLARDAGENVGAYAITGGTLANANYTISVVDGELTVTPRAITVTAADQSKVYGDTDPTLTWAVTGGSLVGADSLSGSLARDAGENVGGYAITGGTLANANYTISVVDGQLTVTPRAITVTAADQSKVYGETDPALTWAVTGGSLVGADSLSGSLARDAGENVGAYAITGGTLANTNYTISVVDGQLTVTPRAITVTAADQTKVYGDTDPTLTWAVTGGSLVGGDSLSGSLARDAGENVGAYAINGGTLANANYTISVVNGTLIITPTPASASDVPDVQTTIVRNAVNAFGTSLPRVGPTGAGASTAPDTGISGGIQFVDAGADTGTPAENGDGASDDVGRGEQNASGADENGFMRVLVVNGGIRLPDGDAGEGAL